MDGDGIVWPPVSGLLSLRHLEITTEDLEPCLAVLADLSSCWCLETLKISRDYWDDPSGDLPDIFLHEVSSLKSVEVIGWYPQGDFTLPSGCLLRFMAVLETHTQWLQWQRKGCPISMLSLYCYHMQLQAWPTGISDMSDLRYLELYCIPTMLHDQDLAALQHIPHVCLVLTAFSTLRLTSGSWQSLQIRGIAGFRVNFSNIDAFVRGTKRFLFDCLSQEAGEMYRVLRAACARQRVACHECEHWTEYSDDFTFAYLSNMKLCREPQQINIRGGMPDHKELIQTDKHGWPSKAAFPELYG